MSFLLPQLFHVFHCSLDFVEQVGKSLIVREVYKPLAKHNGYYVSGKFEQFMTPSPLAAVVQVIFV